MKKHLGHQKNSERYVTSVSLFTDPVWTYDSVNLGQRESARHFNWDISLSDGTSLLAPEHADLLLACREVADGLMENPGAHAALEVTTLTGTFRTKLKKFLDWMLESEFENFADLDSEASWSYLEEILEDFKEKGVNKLSEGQIRYHIDIWDYIYRQSRTLRKKDIPAIAEAPFDGESIRSVAVSAASGDNGWITPYPEIVALPLMNQAERMLDIPAEDVIRLVGNLAFLKKEEKRDFRNQNAEDETAARKKFALEFEFSTVAGQSKAWTAPIGDGTLPAGLTKQPVSRWDAKVVAHFSTIKGACVVSLLSGSGMRVSEISALEGDLEPSNEWPSCVEIRLSKDSMTEIFYIRSKGIKVYKGKSLTWPIASRPAGSNIIPPPVRALQIANRLFAPWRTSKNTSLFMNLPAKVNIPSSKVIGKRAGSTLLRHWCKEFVLRTQCLNFLPDKLETPSGTIDLRGYKSGKLIRTAPWRKNFAHHLIKIDPEIIPALKQHFKHLAVTMTEEGYVGNDPELLSAIDDARTHETVAFLIEQAHGKPVAGGMAEDIIRYRSQIVEVLAKGGAEALREFVIKNDLRIWYDPHGMCYMTLQPGKARCHKLGGSDPWLSAAPNFAYRSATVCGGCACFAVDGRHVPFWKERRANNSALYEKTKNEIGAGAAVAFARMRQADAILRSLGE